MLSKVVKHTQGFMPKPSTQIRVALPHLQLAEADVHVSHQLRVDPAQVVLRHRYQDLGQGLGIGAGFSAGLNAGLVPAQVSLRHRV